MEPGCERLKLVEVRHVSRLVALHYLFANAGQFRLCLLGELLVGELPKHAHYLVPALSPDPEPLAELEVLVVRGQQLEEGEPLLADCLDYRTFSALYHHRLSL